MVFLVYIKTGIDISSVKNAEGKAYKFKEGAMICIFCLIYFYFCVILYFLKKQVTILKFSSQKGLKNVFDEAILAALEPPEPKRRKKCNVLWRYKVFVFSTLVQC